MFCCQIILYHRFQNESERWEALLNKHRTKAEELERLFFFSYLSAILWRLLFKSALNDNTCIRCRKVGRGLEKGVSSSSASVAQSSQYRVVQSKPDYRSLCTQQPLLQAVEIFVSWKFDNNYCNKQLFWTKRQNEKKILIYALISNDLFLLIQRWIRRVGWSRSFSASGSRHSCWLRRPAVDWVNVFLICGHF